jgi:hypothetical protein
MLLFIYYAIIYIRCTKCISTSATLPLFPEVAVSSQECDLMCIMGIECASIYGFSIGVKNCSDSVTLLFCYSFY